MYIKGKKLTLDELSETLIQQELDEKDNSIKALNEKVKAVDSLEAKVLKLEKDLQDAKSIDVEAMVQDRLTVISKAKAYLKDADFTNKSLVEVKAMVVSDHYKKDFTGKSEGVIAELFDLLDEKPAIQQKQTLSDSFKGSGSEDANKLDPQNIIVNRLLKAYDSVEKKEQK